MKVQKQMSLGETGFLPKKGKANLLEVIFTEIGKLTRIELFRPEGLGFLDTVQAWRHWLSKHLSH